MSVRLDPLLALAGRLDDAPGFDAPRERYRRYLLEWVTDLDTLAALIDDAQHGVGEQRHRALQDLIVRLGVFLGFEISWGSYASRSGAVAGGGLWRSPGGAEFVVELRTDQTLGATLDTLAQTVSALTCASDCETRTTRIGLCVTTRQYIATGRLSRAVADNQLHDPELRIVSTGWLLEAAARVRASRLTHTELVALLRRALAVGVSDDWLPLESGYRGPSEVVSQRLDHGPASVTYTQPAMTAPIRDDRARADGYWVATIGGTAGPAERLLTSVVARRRVLGVCHGAYGHEAAAGDAVCFYLPSKGVVGHAEFAGLVQEPSLVIRNAAQYSRVYRLRDVQIYTQPVAQAGRAIRGFTFESAGGVLPGPSIAPIAREEFLAVTLYCGGEPSRIAHHP